MFRPADGLPDSVSKVAGRPERLAGEALTESGAARNERRVIVRARPTAADNVIERDDFGPRQGRVGNLVDRRGADTRREHRHESPRARHNWNIRLIIAPSHFSETRSPSKRADVEQFSVPKFFMFNINYI